MPTQVLFTSNQQTESVRPPNPFYTKWEGEVLRIGIPGKILGDDGWAAHFGAIQTAIRERSFQSNDIRSVVLDLSQCTWVDPLPLLAFTMAFGEFVLQGGKAAVVLPVSDHQADESRRLLQFLALEGFLEQMLKLEIFVKDSRDKEITEKEIKDFGDASVSLRYVNSQCIPALILELSEEEEKYTKDIKEEINEQLDRAELLLRSKERPWANTRLLYTLKVFFRETITNVAEHAYKDAGRIRLVGIYVRYRQGGQGISSEAKENWKEALWAEVGRCPQLERGYLEGKAGCLEAFVIDAGVGMVGRFQARNQLEGKEKNRFQALLYDVFHEGLTTKSEGERATQAGGLGLIYQSLRQNHDYLRGLDDKLWLGVQADFSRKGADNRTPALLKGGGNEMPFRGLAWTARFSWPDSTIDRESKSWAIWQGKNAHPALETFTKGIYRKENFDPIILDQRFDPFLGEGSRLQVGQWEILCRVKPGLMKNDIGRMIESIMERFVASKSQRYNLYLADIPDHEAATYLLIAESLRFHPNQTWPKRLNRIILVTRSLAISIHGLSNSTGIY
ncbi:MAG: hypothetical protein KJO08_10730, partial [Gammaproteobacteria bacterium]|nr:hypothetical protein [Gammaproteobacteria bacterium]